MSISESILSGVGSSRRRSVSQSDDRSGKPSLAGVIAAKRLSKRFTNSLIYRKRTSSKLSASVAPPKVRLEPTYQLEPKKRFNCEAAKRSIQTILSLRMNGFEYSCARGSLMTKRLAEEIKHEVKSLGFERYKIVVHVTLGEKLSQFLKVSSECLWDKEFDTFVTVNHENNSNFASATVFIVYQE